LKPINSNFLKYKNIINFICNVLPARIRGKDLNSANKILIMDCHLIGDIVLLTPFLSALRTKYPNAFIALIAGPWARIILMGNYGLINEFFEFEAPWVKKNQGHRVADIIKLMYSIRCSKWDIAIEMRGDFRQILMLWLCRPRALYGLDLTGGGPLLSHLVHDDGVYRHILDHHKNIAVAMDLIKPNATFFPNIRLSNTEDIIASKINKYTGVHLGASNILRQFEFTDSVSLIDHLLEFCDEKIIIFIAPEYLYMQQIIDHYSHLTARIEFWSGSLRDFIILLSRCNHLYCMDSAPGHIASALDVPASIFFGPAASEFVRPIGASIRIYENNNLTCRPCNQDICINVSYKKCLDGLPKRLRAINA